MPRENNFAFIDGANLHITYKNLDWDIDYEKLRDFLKNKFNVTVAYYFIDEYFWDNEIENAESIESLESYGYFVKNKTAIPYTTIEEYCPYCYKYTAPELVKFKGDCDSFITLEAISNISIYDRAVIITSDGDFDELVKELVLKDKLRLLLAPCREGCSGLLMNTARGRIAFIDDFRNLLAKI